MGTYEWHLANAWNYWCQTNRNKDGVCCLTRKLCAGHHDRWPVWGRDARETSHLIHKRHRALNDASAAKCGASDFDVLSKYKILKLSGRDNCEDKHELSQEKLDWLESIGAEMLLSPINYIYQFQHKDCNLYLSEKEIAETPLCELKAWFNADHDALEDRHAYYQYANTTMFIPGDARALFMTDDFNIFSHTQAGDQYISISTPKSDEIITFSEDALKSLFIALNEIVYDATSEGAQPSINDIRFFTHEEADSQDIVLTSARSGEFITINKKDIQTLIMVLNDVIHDE